MFKPSPKTMLAVALTLLAATAADSMLDTGLVLSQAHARVGRPLTPLSYAGVARRTTRRAIIATSVYAASLPRGCSSVVIEGTRLYQCGATYYQAAGSQYVVVRVQ